MAVTLPVLFVMLRTSDEFTHHRHHESAWEQLFAAFFRSLTRFGPHLILSMVTIVWTQAANLPNLPADASVGVSAESVGQLPQ